MLKSSSNKDISVNPPRLIRNNDVQNGEGDYGRELEKIAELSKDGVFVYNLNIKQFIYFNPAFAKIFDLDPGELLTNPRLLRPFVHSEDHTYVSGHFSDLMAEHKLNGVEFRIKLKDESIRHLCCEAYVMENPARVIGFVEDITRIKEHEDYIVNYGAKKDTLLDMMSHNLAGPLTLSQNILRWMQEHNTQDSSNNLNRQLQMIMDNTQECLNIVNDFLKEEHLASENIFVKKTRFDMLERIMNVLDKLIETNKNKSFRIVTELEDLNITTDSVKFFQIIHNLLSNAIKFTPDNGKIDVVLEETEQTFIVRVRDNGIGIPEKLKANLFEPRSDAGRQGLNNELSNGLGLSIVKKLVDLIDGKLSFVSEENKGTTFTVELPKL